MVQEEKKGLVTSGMKLGFCIFIMQSTVFLCHVFSH